MSTPRHKPSGNMRPPPGDPYEPGSNPAIPRPPALPSDYQLPSTRATTPPKHRKDLQS